ncbi:unnamed protein product [Nesidiocoris tenuis]|uniref:Uncharacterized protein n=1 Tax=Nesidiocoris tenuis TaxID=355587 RepID=A0A6H5GEG9_9HEMI|nr:unnamed protein product [Nesidiocoris tenuis]
MYTSSATFQHDIAVPSISGTANIENGICVSVVCDAMNMTNAGDAGSTVCLVYQWLVSHFVRKPHQLLHNIGGANFVLRLQLQWIFGGAIFRSSQPIRQIRDRFRTLSAPITLIEAMHSKLYLGLQQTGWRFLSRNSSCIPAAFIGIQKMLAVRRRRSKVIGHRGLNGVKFRVENSEDQFSECEIQDENKKDDSGPDRERARLLFRVLLAFTFTHRFSKGARALPAPEEDRTDESARVPITHGHSGHPRWNRRPAGNFARPEVATRAAKIADQDLAGHVTRWRATRSRSPSTV